MRTPPHAVAMGTGAQHTAISSRMRYAEGFDEGWLRHVSMVEIVEGSSAGRGGGGGIGEGGGGKRSGGVNGKGGGRYERGVSGSDGGIRDGDDGINDGDDGRDTASRSVRICLG